MVLCHRAGASLPPHASRPPRRRARHGEGRPRARGRGAGRPRGRGAGCYGGRGNLYVSDVQPVHELDTLSITFSASIPPHASRPPQTQGQAW